MRLKGFPSRYIERVSRINYSRLLTMHATKHRRSGRCWPKKNAERPQQMPRAAADDKTRLLDDDTINVVASFASCHDLCVLAEVCRRFSPLPFCDDLWELRALDILPSVPQVHSAMSQLKLTSFRQLVEAFTLIGIPGGVLGFWQAEAPTLAWDVQQQQQGGLDGTTVQQPEARGELLRITLEAGGFLCESIAPSGTRRRIFTIRVSKTPTGRIKIGFFCLEKESALTIGGDNDSWVPGDSMAEALARYTFAIPGSTRRTPIRASGTKAFFLERNDGRTCRYVKLTAPPASSPGGAAAGAVKNLCGLWCAPYGSHGLEIIQLSTDPSCSPNEETAAAAVKAATVVKLSSLSQSWAGGRGGRRGSVSGSSTSRVTDGSESVCTSTPATDADGSEADSCDEAGGSSEAAGGGGGGGGGGEDDSSDGHGDIESVLDDGCLASIARRKGNSLHHADTATAGSGAGAGDASVPSQLFGFKVTGDDNVPAGKTSFVIDLSTDFDVDEELRSDSRPVVTFLPTGAVMANLANRRQQISCWRKGRGQINRVPGRWSPEWVDVEFVEYRAGSRCAFSVIFRQPNQAVRVVMDFERALGCEEEWPQWSAAAPACAAAAAAAAASDSPSTSAGSGSSVASSFGIVLSQQ
ncbi:unnamed protein product [Ectocarpus sp. CCAP 1310/34]|nr:unnamed protein product [Ectocarpus sp. CCAP 1310/34]